MPVRLEPMRPIPPIRTLLLPVALLAGLFLAACSSGASAPVVSFDPAGPCSTDGQQPGAYPDLEALLPRDYEDQMPENLDSGRTCTAEALGTLATHGIDELKFAGATWKTGGAAGFTMAVFEAAGLDPARMVEFYEAGAKAARKTDTYTVTDVTVGGKPAVRLDVLGSDGSGQTVVAWPGTRDDQVFVLLAANVGDMKTTELLDAFGGG
jgi:hypothetical protein